MLRDHSFQWQSSGWSKTEEASQSISDGNADGVCGETWSRDQSQSNLIYWKLYFPDKHFPPLPIRGRRPPPWQCVPGSAGAGLQRLVRGAEQLRPRAAALQPQHNNTGAIIQASDDNYTIMVITMHADGYPRLTLDILSGIGQNWGLEKVETV